MVKRNTPGQDPLAWIRKTGESESTGAENASAAMPTSPPPVNSLSQEFDQPAAVRSTSRWPFLMIITLDFLLVVLLGYLGYSLLSRRIDDIESRVQRLEDANQQRIEDGRGLATPATGHDAPAPAPRQD
jgi:hypothetical protein